MKTTIFVIVILISFGFIAFSSICKGLLSMLGAIFTLSLKPAINEPTLKRFSQM